MPSRKKHKAGTTMPFNLERVYLYLGESFLSFEGLRVVVPVSACFRIMRATRPRWRFDLFIFHPLSPARAVEENLRHISLL